ncbi:MAG: hypothetical protein IJJ29_05800, partial [Solobacterium sp.]|nr:hypothetical protein [Solobacterium sp.]
MLQKLNNTLKTLLLVISAEAVLILGLVIFSGRNEMLVPACLIIFGEYIIVIYAFERFRQLAQENTNGLETMLG